MLVALELFWAVKYYQSAAFQDGVYFRALVAVTLVIDFANFIGLVAEVYLVRSLQSIRLLIRLQLCVSHWGERKPC